MGGKYELRAWNTQLKEIDDFGFCGEFFDSWFAMHKRYRKIRKQYDKILLITTRELRGKI